MVVNCDRQSFLRVILANALNIELTLDFRGLGDVNPRLLFARLCRKFFVEDLLAQHDAIIADVNARTGDQFFDFGVGLPAKAAQRDIRRARHAGYSFLSARLVARSKPGISLRD
jgi:hypothetical protein